MSQSFMRRLEKLERRRGIENEVSLEELVCYSLDRNKAPDPDFERRLAKSTLGRLIVEISKSNE